MSTRTVGTLLGVYDFFAAEPLDLLVDFAGNECKLMRLVPTPSAVFGSLFPSYSFMLADPAIYAFFKLFIFFCLVLSFFGFGDLSVEVLTPDWVLETYCFLILMNLIAFPGVFLFAVLEAGLASFFSFFVLFFFGFGEFALLSNVLGIGLMEGEASSVLFR